MKSERGSYNGLVSPQTSKEEKENKTSQGDPPKEEEVETNQALIKEGRCEGNKRELRIRKRTREWKKKEKKKKIVLQNERKKGWRRPMEMNV